jgi:hypothetical protein
MAVFAKVYARYCGFVLEMKAGVVENIWSSQRGGRYLMMAASIVRGWIWK